MRFGPAKCIINPSWNVQLPAFRGTSTGCKQWCLSSGTSRRNPSRVSSRSVGKVFQAKRPQRCEPGNKLHAPHADRHVDESHPAA